jgi:dTDP-4-dehydrorhamnose reductase
MRVLVTGSQGLLGSAIRRHFADHEVLAMDRHSLDVTDRDVVDSVIGKARPDAVIHCAAYNDVDKAQDEPAAALQANSYAVRAVARAASRLGAVLVHYSSDFVFDGETDRPYVEDDPPNPSSVYAASKLLGDWFALESPRANVLRVESLFGRPGPGATRRGSLGQIVDRISRDEEVPLFTDRVVSPTHTDDIARATLHLLRSSASPGLYHCVNGGCATWLQIGQHIANVLGRTLRTRPMTLAAAKLRARRPRYCALSNAKLAAAGFEMPSWQEAVETFLRSE